VSEKLKGKLTISRVHNGHEGDRVEIRVDDESSGCRAFQADMSIEEFGNAVLNLGFRPCDYELNTSGVCGKDREIKSVVIKRPAGYLKTHDEKDKYIRRAAKKFLVDGWEPHGVDDVCNSYRWCGIGEVSVGLIRFVEANPRKESP